MSSASIALGWAASHQGGSLRIRRPRSSRIATNDFVRARAPPEGRPFPLVEGFGVPELSPRFMCQYGSLFEAGNRRSISRTASSIAFTRVFALALPTGGADDACTVLFLTLTASRSCR